MGALTASFWVVALVSLIFFFQASRITWDHDNLADPFLIGVIPHGKIKFGSDVIATEVGHRVQIAKGDKVAPCPWDDG